MYSTHLWPISPISPTLQFSYRTSNIFTKRPIDN